MSYKKFLEGIIIAMFCLDLHSSEKKLIHIGDNNHRFVEVNVKKADKVRIVYEADKSIHAINIYNNKSGVQIAQGTIGNFQLTNSSKFNSRVDIFYKNNTRKNTVKFILKLVNLQYEDDVTFSVHATFEKQDNNATVTHETTSNYVRLFVYDPLSHCRGKITSFSVTTLKATSIVCGKPLVKVDWYLDGLIIYSDEKERTSEEVHVITVSFAQDEGQNLTRNCGKRLHYIAEGFNGSKLTSFTKFPFIPSHVMIQSVTIEENCIIINNDKVGTGYCSVIYNVALMSAENYIRKLFSTDDKELVKYCFENTKQANEITSVAVRMTLGNARGDWRNASVETRVEAEDNASPPMQQIVAVMSSVVVFFLAMHVVVYRVLRNKEKEVNQYLARKTVRANRRKKKAKQLKVINLWKPRAHNIDEVENENKSRQMKFLSLWRSNAHKTEECEKSEEEARNEESESETEEETENENGIKQMNVWNKWRANVNKSNENEEKQEEEVKQTKVLKKWRRRVHKIDEEANFFHKWKDIARKAEKETTLEEEQGKGMKILSIWRTKIEKMHDSEEESHLEEKEVKYFNKWKKKSLKTEVKHKNEKVVEEI